MKRASLLFFALALGCAQGVPLDGVELVEPVSLTEPATEEHAHDAPTGCGLRVDSSEAPELTGFAENGADRWSSRTGCQVTTGEAAGQPVVRLVLLDEVINTNGEVVEARTVFHDWGDRVVVDRIEVTRFWLDYPEEMQLIIDHELGHALGGYGAQAHSDTGLMREDAQPGDPIDDSSLHLVCADTACPAMSVE